MRTITFLRFYVFRNENKTNGETVVGPVYWTLHVPVKSYHGGGGWVVFGKWYRAGVYNADVQFEKPVPDDRLADRQAGRDWMLLYYFSFTASPITLVLQWVSHLVGAKLHRLW